MNENLFKSYPKDIQQVLVEEASRAGQEMTEMTKAQNKKILEEMRSYGVEVIEDIDVAAYRKATERVYEDFPDWSNGLHQEIQNILNAQ